MGGRGCWGNVFTGLDISVCCVICYNCMLQNNGCWTELLSALYGTYFWALRSLSWTAHYMYIVKITLCKGQCDELRQIVTLDDVMSNIMSNSANSVMTGSCSGNIGLRTRLGYYTIAHARDRGEWKNESGNRTQITVLKMVTPYPRRKHFSK